MTAPVRIGAETVQILTVREPEDHILGDLVLVLALEGEAELDHHGI